MDKMKKLLMMDSRTFNRLTTPKDKVLTSIEGDMSSILNDESIPEDVKAKLYASAQSRYLKIEHPQWGETTVTNTKTLNPPNAVVDNTPQNLARRGKPLSSILKNNNRVLINDKNDSSMDSEDVPGLDETELWTPNYFQERSSTGRLSNEREYSGPPFYGAVKTPNVNDKDSLMTPDDFLEKLPRGRTEPPIYITPGRPNTRTEPQIYVTPGRPNTRRRRKKIKYDTLFKK